MSNLNPDRSSRSANVVNADLDNLQLLSRSSPASTDHEETNTDQSKISVLPSECNPHANGLLDKPFEAEFSAKSGMYGLRRPVETDIKAISRFAGVPEIAKMTGSIPLPYPALSAETWYLILRARTLNPNVQHHEIFVIAPVDNPEDVIGVMGLHFVKIGRWEVGYWVRKDHWGCGIASSCLRSALRWGAENLGEAVVEACYNEDNLASRKVLEKAGFESIGVCEKRFSIARLKKSNVILMERPGGWSD